MTEAQRMAYRINEAAERVGISRATIYRWISTGKLKTVKIGSIRLISERALRSLLENH